MSFAARLIIERALSKATGKNPRPMQEIIALGEEAGLTRGDMKETRKALGVTSFSTVAGTQMWYMEEDEA